MNSKILKTLRAMLLAAPAMAPFAGAAQAQTCPKTGGTLTYAYSLEPSALSTIATSAVPVALVSIFAFFRTSGTGMRERANILLTATFLITPYALNYDLGGFAAAIAMMASTDMAAGRQPQWRTAMFALAMLLPVLMILLSPIRGSIAPVVIFAMWLTALRQAGFTASLPGRRRQASPAAA